MWNIGLLIWWVLAGLVTNYNDIYHLIIFIYTCYRNLVVLNDAEWLIIHVTASTSADGRFWSLYAFYSLQSFFHDSGLSSSLTVCIHSPLKFLSLIFGRLKFLLFSIGSALLTYFKCVGLIFPLSIYSLVPNYKITLDLSKSIWDIYKFKVDVIHLTFE